MFNYLFQNMKILGVKKHGSFGTEKKPLTEENQQLYFNVLKN